MSEIKSKVQGLDPNVQAHDLLELVDRTNNVYEALAIITKRARQLNVEIKQELLGKLDEFQVNTESIEEVIENKEQIEISKYYERLPNPAIIATNEYLDGDLYYRYNEKAKDQDDV